MNLAERIIVALDVSSEEEMETLLTKLPAVRTVKVGMELFYSTGPYLVERLKERDLKVFVDLKVHDIPATAYGAVRSLSKLGCDILTLHCAGGIEMMRRAQEGLSGDTKLIGVTQLTSTDQLMLNEQLGIEGTVHEAVLRYASLAHRAGLDGIVCSPNEVSALRTKYGSSFLTVTPGVRPQGSSLQDQKRVMTPAEALQAGSDYLVIGRPITKSTDPAQAFQGILNEMEEAI